MESNLRTLKNGAIYDMDKKRIVANPGGGAHAITSERASEFAKQRQERKRAIIAQAAAAAVERDDYRANYGGDAWIAAIAETQYIKATTPDDPKSTDAARFLLQETGLAEAKAQAQAQVSDIPAIVSALADFAARLRAQDVQVVDAQVADAGTQAQGAGTGDKDDGGW